MLDMNTNPDRSRRDVTVSASPSPTPPENSSAVAVADKPRVGRKTTSTQASGSMRTGRWTLDEKLLFLYGLRMYGKGRWKKISVYLPNRYVRAPPVEQQHANSAITGSITHFFLILASDFTDLWCKLKVTHKK
eukprot:scaffold4155_cov165-Amphora_coffeaeformis.AAC.12